MTNPIISCQDLYQKLNDDDLKLIDVSVKNIIGKEPIIYQSKEVIPNSLFLDLVTELTDTNSQQPNHFPRQNQVEEALKNLDVQKDSPIAIYDNQGVYSAPRAWYILQSYGLKNLAILDGGLPEWIKQGYPTINQYLDQKTNENNNLSANNLKLDLKLNQAAITTKEQILDNFNKQEFMIIDIRSSERFLGTAAEPRLGMRSGHIPDSVNLPFGLLFDDNRYKSKDQLEGIFTSLIKNKKQPLVFSCGSGLTACIAIVAAKIAGYHNLSLYDGSWSEWGGDPSTPIEQ